MPGQSHEWQQHPSLYLDVFRLCPSQHNPKYKNEVDDAWTRVCTISQENPAIGKPGVGVSCEVENDLGYHWQSISENQGQDVADDINHTRLHIHRDNDEKSYKVFHIYLSALVGASKQIWRVQGKQWDRYCDAGDIN